MFLTYICLIQLYVPTALNWKETKKRFSALADLVFPENCTHCEKELAWGQKYLCIRCWEQIVPAFDVSNEINHRFNFRINLQFTQALFLYTKNNPIQSLIHALKYNHQYQVGHYLGQQIGMRIKSHSQNIDYLLPIPLHHKKEFQRGYNQSTEIAKGITDITGLRIEKDFLFKRKNEQSQTKKNLLERKLNFNDKFCVSKAIKGSKHILLVDDVFTTGSTVEAAFESIKSIEPNVLISFACVALTTELS